LSALYNYLRLHYMTLLATLPTLTPNHKTIIFVSANKRQTKTGVQKSS